jgi:hypothetical protein
MHLKMQDKSIISFSRTAVLGQPAHVTAVKVNTCGQRGGVLCFILNINDSFMGNSRLCLGKAIFLVHLNTTALKQHSHNFITSYIYYEV